VNRTLSYKHFLPFVSISIPTSCRLNGLDINKWRHFDLEKYKTSAIVYSGMQATIRNMKELKSKDTTLRMVP